jgi:Transposase
VAGVMIGIDPRKASHTATAIDGSEKMLGKVGVKADRDQPERLLEWASCWPERTWAVENATGLGHLITQQLLTAGEAVLDVPPKLAAKARLLSDGNTNKNDPNDARSVAVAGLRSTKVRPARREDYSAVMGMWSDRYLELAAARTQVVCRRRGDRLSGRLPRRARGQPRLRHRQRRLLVRNRHLDHRRLRRRGADHRDRPVGGRDDHGGRHCPAGHAGRIAVQLLPLR